jgi:hypothetical protein
MRITQKLKGFLLLFLLLIPVGLFAQDVVVPSDWKDLYDNYEVFLATYLGIAGVATFLGEYAIRLLKLTTKFQKVAVVVLLAVGVSFLTNGFNISYLAEATWWETLLWGGLSAATASGLRSTNLLFVKTVVDFLIGLIKSKEPAA